MRRINLIPVVLALLGLCTTPALASPPKSMRIAGNYSFNTKHVNDSEKPFFNELPKTLGLDIRVNFNPMDVVNVNAQDALRLLRSGAFDVMSVSIATASRDDPFFEGVDLVGVAPDAQSLQKSVAAYREVLDQRLQKRFNIKALTLWPFGSQIFFSNKRINSVEDFKGMRIRTYTPTMAALVKTLGATPVSIAFSETYSSLQRGVVDGAITSPISGNTGKWAEVTKYLFPLSIASGIQGHFMNLDYWNSFTPEQQKILVEEFAKLEKKMWELDAEGSGEAIACSTGQPQCTADAKFSMELLPVSEADLKAVREAVNASVLPLWGENCNKVDPECTKIWNDTVGKALGFSIQ